MEDLLGRQRALSDATAGAVRGTLWWLVASLVLVGVFVVTARRRLSVPLAELDAGLSRLAAGDLNAQVPVRRADEVGRLAAHFNQMTHVLRGRAEEQGQFAAAGELMAGVAHEVNNPLMAIAAVAELRLREPELDPELRTELEQIVAQARRASKLLAGLLRFVRADQEGLAPADLNAVIQRAIDLVAYRFGVDEITLEARLDPGIPLALCNAARMEQVFVNLLANGLDALVHVPPPRRLAVESWFEGEHVFAAVSDNGPGVPAAVARALFGPFVTTKGARGTGLGLYISRQIAREAGGDLTYGPASERGARFVVRLPPSAAASVAEVPQRPPADHGAAHRLLGGLTVLVVDDEAAVRRPLAAFLERRGARVLEAANGRDALEQLEGADADVIVADLRMPVLDGAGLFAALRARRPDLASRVLFLSGDLTQVSDPQAVAALEATRVLAKPIELMELEARILDIVATARDAAP